MFEFKLPDIGEGVHEAQIVRWLVQPGERVREDQPLVEVETDKVTAALPSPVSGQVKELRVAAGRDARVGDVLVVIEPDGATPARLVPAAAPPAATASAAASSVTTIVGAAKPVDAPPGAASRALAAPAVRRVARELGVDINQVRGTGPGGRVLESDVRAFAASVRAGTSAPPLAGTAVPTARLAPPGDGPAEERVPVAGLRKRIAEAMTRSARTVAAVTALDEADATELVALRKRLQPAADAQGVKLTYLPLLIKIVVAALRQHPYLNATLDDQAGEIVLKRRYHVGIATAVPDGLIVPVIHDADRKSVLQIAGEAAHLANRARGGGLQLADVQGGTFTITNLGSFGGLFGTPIIHHPEVAILGTGRIQDKPVARDGQVVIRSVMGLSLTFDHRVIDGEGAGRFMRQVIDYIENPHLLLLELS